MANGNPFYVEPLGGYGRDIAQGIQGLGNVIQAKREKESQLARQQEAQQALMSAVQSNDPMKMRDVAIMYPEIQQQLETAFKFSNEQTKQVSTDTYSRVLSDPANAVKYLTAGIEEVRAKGGNPVNMTKDLAAFQQNPEAAYQSVQMGVAGVAPDVYKAFIDRRDYAMKGQELDLKRLNTSLRAHESQLRRLEQGLKSEENALKRSELALKVQEKQIEVENKRREQYIAADDIRSKISSTDDTAALVDRVLYNEDYISALTGIRGKAPAIPGTSGYDAEIAFNQLKDNLTLENLKKMPGVLTDRDIQVLSSAASGMEVGMSESTLKSRLKKIKDFLVSKSSAERAKLKRYGLDMDSLPSDTEPAAVVPVGEMSNEELMRQAFGGGN